MKKIVVYSTPTCGFCKMAKEFFSENKVEYSDYDVSTDSAKAEEMVEISGQMGVPVIVIGDADEREVQIGFDQAKLSASLGL